MTIYRTKQMKGRSLALAAWLAAVTALLTTSCSNYDDPVAGGQPAQGGTYTMAISASKGGAATTRALAPGSSGTLDATWQTTDNVWVKKSSTWSTTALHPDADGATATLKGTLSGLTVSASDNLTLQFPRQAVDYSGQVGTLADIAENFDYATATVTVTSVKNKNIVADPVTFGNQQAIVKFTLKDAGGSALSVSSLTVSATGLKTTDAATGDITITPAEPTSEIYAALSGISGQTVTLTATAGSSTYTYEKANVAFANGQYYAITVKMTEQSASARALAEATPDDIGKIAGADGIIYDTKEAAEAAGTIAVAMIAYVGSDAETNSTYRNGLALALKDVSGTKTWCLQYSVACLGAQYSSASDAKGDMAGIANTDALVNQTSHTHAAATAARNYKYADGVDEGAHPEGTSDWFLPSAGQWDKMATAAGGYANLKTNADLQSFLYWSGSESDAYSAWYFRAGNGDWYDDNKDYDNLVRACLAF